MKPFVPNQHCTLGIEEEFHLIDPATGELVGRVDDVRAALDEDLRKSTCYEQFTCVLENRTGVFAHPAELAAAALRARRRLARAAARCGVALAAAGTHPFADWRKLTFVDDEHYRWVLAHQRHAVRRQVAFALHVHVGVRSAEAAIDVMYRLRRWVYVLLALSANSPFFEAADTGFDSARTHLLDGMPRMDLAPPFADWGELETHYERLLAAGDITAPRELWWAIRPQPPLGTVEIRVMDLPTDPARLAPLIALAQATVATFQDDFLAGRPAPRLDEGLLAQNRWRALRDGLAATIVDAATGEVVPMAVHAGRLIDLVSLKAEELGTGGLLDEVWAILRTGNEAGIQRRRLVELGGDLAKLELDIARQTVPG